MEKATKDELEKLDRRLLRAASNGDSLNAVREAFKPEDFAILHQATREQPEEVRLLMRIKSRVDKELARGERCAVCGMTDKQAEAVNYDCLREC